MIASKRRLCLRSIVGAAAATCLLGSAVAQETLKIGLLANPIFFIFVYHG